MMCTRSSEVSGKFEDNLFASDNIECDSSWSVSNWVLKLAIGRYVIENEVAGIEFSEFDGLVLLDHRLKNADVLVFRNFDCEERVSFVAKEVAAE